MAYSSARRISDGRGDRRAVVGEGDRAAGDELAELGQLLPLASLADGADRDRRWPCRARCAWRTTNSAAAWVSMAGMRVGHAGDRVTPPARAALGAGGDRLVLLVAGLAEVDVDVDQARGRRSCPRASMTISASS